MTVCAACGCPVDPDVTHVHHGPYCYEPDSYGDGCDCPEVCAACCQDPDCVLRDSQENPR